MQLRIFLFLSLLFLPQLLPAQMVAETLPYSQFFDSGQLPQGWTQQYSGGITANLWSISPTSTAGGASGEAHATWFFGIGTSRLVSPPLITDSLGGLQLSFRHFMDDYYFGLEFKVQSSSDGITWTDENWHAISGFGALGPEQIFTTVSHNPGDTTFIAFTIEGDHYEFWGWNIDDVVISPLSGPPVCTFNEFPLDNDTAIPTNSELKWETAAGATDYYLYLGTDNPPTNLINGILTNSHTGYSVFNLQTSTQYYWKIVPSNFFGEPAGCQTWSFNTQAPFNLPFTEEFSGTDLPSGWIETDSAVTKGWYIYQGNYAGGEPNELEFDFKSAVGLSRYISPPIQTSGESLLTLKFKTLFGDDVPGMSVKVQTSTDAVHWVDEDWEHFSGTGSIGPEELTIPIYRSTGGIMYIAFVLTGDLYTFNYWVIDDVILESGGDFPATLSGTIQYDKSPAVPLNGVWVYLATATGIPIDTATTDLSGHFEFDSLVAGEYALSYHYAHNWGGGNAVDALLTMKHFTNLSNLAGVRLKAADVNNSGNVNSIDALLIMKRFVGLESGYNSGDWCFETTQVNIPPNGNIVKLIKAVCYGDVDASFNP